MALANEQVWGYGLPQMMKKYINWYAHHDGTYTDPMTPESKFSQFTRDNINMLKTIKKVERREHRLQNINAGR